MDSSGPEPVCENHKILWTCGESEANEGKCRKDTITYRKEKVL